MNITMNRAELLSAAQKAAAIASENAPLEPLKGVLLEANSASGTLTMTATNIETSLEQKLSCPIGEDDAVVMNAKLLAGMLGLMSGDTVELRRLAGSHVLSLRSGETVYDWTIGERGEFPKMQIPFPEDTVTVRGIPSIARRTLFATEDNKDKPLLKCVNFMFTQEGLKGAGYNGRSMVTAKGDDKSTGNISLLVPATALEKLAELCTDQDEFKVGTTGPSIVFMRPGLTFSTRLMEGDFVDIGRLKLIAANLRKAVENAPEGREGMALGQFVTGMAFSNVGLGIAHSMAHTLGAVYDTPHGVACAMMLPIVMEYNQDATGDKFKHIAEAMGVDTTGMDQAAYRKAAVDAVRQLSVDVGIPTKLEGMKEEDLEFLAQSAAADACAPGNPKAASVEDFKELFRKIM